MVGLLGGIGLFLLTQLAIATINRLTLHKLDLHPPSTKFPLVSILVPARNEQDEIEGCVRSLLTQDYPHFELLALDDDSQDQTSAILARLADADPRMTAYSGKPLPAGWIGKSWACAQLAELAQGELLLFADADTRHDPGTLRAAVAALQREDADLLVVWPRLVARSLGEQLVVPLIPWSVFSLLSLPLAQRLRSPALSAAIGQYLLFRTAAYRAIGGHSAIRGHAAEDLALARQVKRAGLRWRLVDGQRLLSTRMYTDFRAAWAGLSKNLYPAFDYRPLPLILAWSWLNLTAWAPPLALLGWRLGWLPPEAGTAMTALAAAAAGIGLLLWILILRQFGYPAWLAMLHPLILLIGLALAANSLWSTHTGRAHWKGRPLTTPIGVAANDR